MQLQKEIARKIVRDALLSVFIYALPVVLMFFFFYITGQRPWVKKAGGDAAGTTAQTIHAKKTTL